MGRGGFFLVSGQLSQDHHFTSEASILSPNVLTTAQLNVAGQWRFFAHKRFFLDTTLGLRYYLPTSKGQIRAKSGYGLPVFISANYWHTSNAWLRWEWQTIISQMEVVSNALAIGHLRLENAWLLTYGWQY